MEIDKNLTNMEMKRILTDVIDLFLKPHFLSLGLDASGLWLSTIEARGDTIWGQPYTAQLVYGRSPGTFAPIAPLKRWAQIKLGMSEKQALSIAFAISNKLKKEGSEIYKKGGTDLLAILSSPQVVGFINLHLKNFIELQIVIFMKQQFADNFK